MNTRLNTRRAPAARLNALLMLLILLTSVLAVASSEPAAAQGEISPATARFFSPG